MATKKSAKNQASKKVASKTGGRYEGPRLKEQDPPIVVGGGNSTYIWIKKGLSLTFQPNPTPDYPINMNSYVCWDVNIDITRQIKVHDGVNSQNPHPVRHPRRHRTTFE
jgi:hypothetical protein